MENLHGLLGRAVPALLLMALITGPLKAREVADVIITGGPVITVNDAAPEAEAVAIKDGRILSVGSREDVMARQGEGTRMYDLAGRTLLPGFVDSHGHVAMGGLQALSANLLAPPDGAVVDIPGLVKTLQDWLERNRSVAEVANIIVGFGYDQSQLKEQRHPTRIELDEVSTEIPVIIVHQSGHFGTVNSEALRVAGISGETPDPEGGIIRHDENGKPNGVLEENAFFAVLGQLVGGVGPEGFKAFVEAGVGLWASYGFTTAQEGRATPAVSEILKTAGAEGLVPIDVVVYPDVLVDRDYISTNTSRSYANHVRIGGAKLTIDGSPQGFTALRDRPYWDPVGDYPPGYSGYASATMSQVVDALDWAFANGIQILTHANGEGASDMLISAARSATENHGAADRRPVLIHGQFLRIDQVDALQDLQIFPSVFPMHTFYWGDWHRDHTVGPVHADNISPTGWFKRRGMWFGTHHDAPVAFPDSMRVLDATVTRRTRSGDILGPDQRVDVMTALKAMTLWPAWQHFEEHQKGSIEVGKLADLVVLSDNPLMIDPEDLDTLRVMATIKEGELVYQVAETGDGDSGSAPFFTSNFPPGTGLAVGREVLEVLEAHGPEAE